jgi:hypothetical protein
LSNGCLKFLYAHASKLRKKIRQAIVI